MSLQVWPSRLFPDVQNYLRMSVVLVRMEWLCRHCQRNKKAKTVPSKHANLSSCQGSWRVWICQSWEELAKGDVTQCVPIQYFHERVQALIQNAGKLAS
jgi:hypothetical protein